MDEPIKKEIIVQCRICGDCKSFKDFVSRPNTKLGIRRKCKECYNLHIRNKWKEYRELIFKHYGRKCKCCRECNEEFLTLDHVNDDGFKDKNPNGDKKSGKELYLLVKKQGFPDKYQILCQNCNWGKKIKKICPHQIKNLLTGNIQEIVTSQVRFNENLTVRLKKDSVEILQEDQRVH